MNATIRPDSGDFTVINSEPIEMPLGGKIRDINSMSCKGNFDTSHEGIVFKGSEQDAYRRVNKGFLKIKKP